MYHELYWTQMEKKPKPTLMKLKKRKEKQQNLYIWLIKM